MVIDAVIDQNGGKTGAVAGEIRRCGIFLQIADNGAAAGIALTKKQDDLRPLTVAPGEFGGQPILGVHIQHHSFVCGLSAVIFFGTGAAEETNKDKDHP